VCSAASRLAHVGTRAPALRAAKGLDPACAHRCGAGFNRSQEEALMMIYAVMIAMVRSVYALSRKVQQHDPDLARQMRRASSSVALNGLEGWHSRAGHRIERFHNSMGSARETLGCLDLSAAVGYLTEAEVAADLDRLDHIVAVMWKLSKRRK
jgi:four helix bundle protein